VEEQESSEVESYEDNYKFINKDYEGFMFVQDVTCDLNDKAGIPRIGILSGQPIHCGPDYEQ